MQKPRGFILSMPAGKEALNYFDSYPGDLFRSTTAGRKAFGGLPSETHCTDRAQTSTTATARFELCPASWRFGQKCAYEKRHIREQRKKSTNTTAHTHTKYACFFCLFLCRICSYCWRFCGREVIRALANQHALPARPHLRAAPAQPLEATDPDEVGGATLLQHLEQARPPLSHAVGLASECSPSLTASVPRLFFFVVYRFDERRNRGYAGGTKSWD